MTAHQIIRPFIPSVEEIAARIEREMRDRATIRKSLIVRADPSPDFGWQQEGESLDPYEAQPFGLSRSV